VVNDTMDALESLRKQLDGDGDDLLREMVAEFARRLIAAEVDALTGARWGEVSPERLNHRNGYRQRPFDTRVGSVDLAIPKLRRGSYFPDWLLDPRRRAEKALVAVVAECYVRGVSTRRVDGLVNALGVESLSKSQVSRMVGALDGMVSECRSRPLDAGPYTYDSHPICGTPCSGRLPEPSMPVAERRRSDDPLRGVHRLIASGRGLAHPV
jgi:putative transposase